MASQGSVIARVYTSDAFLPLRGVPVVFTQTQPDGSRQVLAIRTTDASGLTEPVYIQTPDTADSQTPGNPLRPFASVDISTAAPGYGSILAEGVQIFPGVETIQGLMLLPRSPLSRTEGETVISGTQSL